MPSCWPRNVVKKQKRAIGSWRYWRAYLPSAPLSFLVTPNIPEAERVSGIEIHNLSDAEEVVKRIYQLSASNVLIKDCHAPFPVDMKNRNKVVDVLYGGKSVTHFDSKRIQDKAVHGNGCVGCIPKFL